MSDHQLVEWTLTRLSEQWDSAAVPEDPRLIDGDDGRVYEIVAGGGTAGGDRVGQDVVGEAVIGEVLGRRRLVSRDVSVDLTRGAVVTVDSTPTRQTTPVGTEFDYEVEDAVSVEIEAAHTDEYGTIADGGEFRRLVRAVKSTILGARVYPTIPEARDQQFHTIVTEGDQPLPGHTQTDFYGRTFDVVFRGFETLPR